ncbi:MAG: flagellar biosynthesis protein FlgB [Planctomycetota bacterium]
MFNPLQATTIDALEKTLAFTERRHQVLAGNLANISTPDYRSRDLDVGAFQSALADSIQARNTPASSDSSAIAAWTPEDLFQQKVAAMRRASSALAEATASTLESNNLLAATSVPDDGSAEPPTATTRDDVAAGPRHAMEGIVYHDNSDVSLEQEVTRMAKNKHLHDVAIVTMRSQFDLMRAAITERA